MARLGLELLAKEKPEMAELNFKVKETENSIWYKSGTNYGKTATHHRAKNAILRPVIHRSIGAHANIAVDQATKKNSALGYKHELRASTAHLDPNN